jgi:DNA-3-methyladenine glycosylase I
MSDPAFGTETGQDGLDRCWWCLGAPEYTEYHDVEWGQPVRDDQALFEILSLEAFQSGLSWLTILRKRAAFRDAFMAFDFELVAEFGTADVRRLLGDASIVRHRGKIEGTIQNARAIRRLRAEGGAVADLFWSFAPDRVSRRVPASSADLESATAESTALAKELKRRGFALIGPTTGHSIMQAAGLVNDHLAGCAFRDSSARSRSGERAMSFSPYDGLQVQ